jgi:23S rRNA (cytidine2498-2'-O)-methyltransferase
MHLLLWAEDSEAELRSELSQSFPATPAAEPRLVDGPSGRSIDGDSLCTSGQLSAPVFIAAHFQIVPGQRLPPLAFARQLLADARPFRAESIRDWASRLFEAVAGVLPDDQPWSLHIEPHYDTRTTHRIGARAWHSRTRKTEWAIRNAGGALAGAAAEAGRHRCQLIREALTDLLHRKRRHLLRHIRREPVPFTAKDSFVQLLLTAPDTGCISVAVAPMPFEQRHLVSPFPKGEVPAASDKTAPSRAFAKLLEAESRLGRAIQAGETCVDLGAAPGSWTYVALSRGARVIAVDRSPLREDLMRSRQVEFQAGDAFRFRPPRPVDWLLCDVIAAPERTAALLIDWLRHGWCRHFVVTVKLGPWQRAQETPDADVLAALKRELPPLTRELHLTRLCANKREVCAFGLANNPSNNTST